jgi:alpha-L-arabinofuranosidase
VNARGLIFAAHRGVVRRSTHPVFSLYRAAAGGIAVTVDADVPAIDGYSAPILDAAAVRGPDNVLRLFVVNRDPHQPMKCDVTVDGFPVSSPRGRRLTARSLDAYNDFDHPNDVRIADWPVRWTGPSSPITFPPRSLCVLKLSDAAASPE